MKPHSFIQERVFMARLGVNVDHVATLRQARGGHEPDPIMAASLVQLAGAEGVVIHLREDRRHIQDRDLTILRETVHIQLNLEMAAEDSIAKIALHIKPDIATLVPERRQELTTEGGLDVIEHRVCSAATRQRELRRTRLRFLSPRLYLGRGDDARDVHCGCSSSRRRARFSRLTTVLRRG